MSISQSIVDRIQKTAALSNETRLRIVLAIFNTEVLKIGHSLTLSQLEKALKIDKHDLTYHLSILQEAGIITKAEHDEGGKVKLYYRTTSEGIKLLELLGITKNKIEEIAKEADLEA